MKSNFHRRRFLANAGALSLGSFLPFSKKISALNSQLPGPQPTACTLIPSETRGPFPLFDSSAIASQTALMRSDIRESQTGVPLTLTITVQNLSCTPLAGCKVYIWHCSKAGLYSGYSNSMNPGQAGLTYLRGIQTTDGSGQVTFTTVFPGWYNGRLTHIHVEVYNPSNTLLLTSQFAFPLDSVAGTSTQLVNAYYGNSNNTITAYSGDNVFNDGYADQLLTLTGSVAAGYTASHTFTANYVIVPLRLISFTAGIENRNPMLWWITENEENLSHFEVEQSTHPSRNFETIGSVTAKNSSATSNYSFSLQQPLPAEITYYRLKIIDKDGSIQYSTVVNLHDHTLDGVSLLNSFTDSKLIIKHPALYGNSALKIVNISGQLVATGKLQTGVSLTSIDVKKLAPGTYMLIIESGIDRFVTKFYKSY